MSWFGKLFSRARPDNQVAIVQAYGAVSMALEEQPKGEGGSNSAALLPFDKEIIKAAITDLVTNQNLSDEQLGAFGVSYLELAGFQPDGGRPSAMYDMDLSPQDFAKQVLATSNREREMGERVLAEMTLLASEWDLIKANRPIHA